VETCESAHEFLLEPWVLIHLPFKPVLLHQWLVGTLAATLQFEKEVSEFFHSPVPSSLHKSVRRLAAVLKKLHELIFKAFNYLEVCTRDCPNMDKRPIIRVLEELLAPLEFVCGTEGQNMVRALKRKLAGEGTKDEEWVEVVKESSHPRRFLYSIEFWLGKQKHDLLFGEQRNKAKVNPAWLQHSPRVVTEEEFLDIVREFVPQTPITEQLRTSLLLEFRGSAHLRLVLLKYYFYSKGSVLKMPNYYILYYL
jgi:hypothetical protein